MSGSKPLKLVIPVRPAGKGRPKFGNGRVYTPKATKDYEELIGWYARKAMVGRKAMTGPVRLTVVASFKSKERGWHTTKPDGDNVMKAVCDALNGIVFGDDSQCAIKTISKIKAMDDLLEVTVEELSAKETDVLAPPIVDFTLGVAVAE